MPGTTSDAGNKRIKNGTASVLTLWGETGTYETYKEGSLSLISYRDGVKASYKELLTHNLPKEISLPL